MTPSTTAERAELRRLSALYNLLSELTRAKSLPDVYQAALAALSAGTNANRFAVQLFDAAGELRFEAWQNLSPEYRAALTGHCPWPKGIREAEAVLIPDVFVHQGLPDYRDAFRREHIAAVAFIPLEVDQGVIGSLMLCYSHPHECREDELAIARVVAGHVALAIERTQARNALHQSEYLLQQILDNSPALIFIKDSEGRFLLVNRRFEDLFHMRRDDIVGKADAQIYPAQLAQRLRENDRRVLESGHSMMLEEQIVYGNAIHTYLTVKFPIHDPNGNLTRICGIGTDISDRKDLEALSLHTAAIVESSDDAIVSKDLNGIVTSWNKGAERIFGYSAEEMIGKPIARLAAPDITYEMPRILEKIRSGERIHHFQTRRRRKDGEIIDVSLTVSPVRDASGRIIGASKIARDITEQKRIERDRAISLAREQEARKTAELLNRVGPLLATELSVSKLVQAVTDVATELVGAEFGSFFHNVVNQQGESYMLYTLSGVPREAFAQFPMPRNTELFGATFRGEGIVRCDDVTKDPRYGKNPPHYGMPKGHLPVRSYLAAPVISRSGEVLGGLFFGHSIPGMFTEQHESLLAGIAAQASVAMDNARLFETVDAAQKELRRSNEELRRANQDLETFAYSASHDLQEPLRTISITTQFLARRYKQHLPESAVPLLDTVVSAAQRMESLIRDVLAYATATRQEQNAATEIDPNAVLSSVIRDLGTVITETGATVTSESLPPVCAHQNRLAQVFQNLIGNALKYRGLEPARVGVSAVVRDGRVVFSVTDNGIGIDPAFADQIFGLFKRLHSHDEYSGSGIGLALCQRIVEQYGGRIWLERSTPGQGSTFCFTLPAVQRAGNSRG